MVRENRVREHLAPGGEFSEFALEHTELRGVAGIRVKGLVALYEGQVPVEVIRPLGDCAQQQYGSPGRHPVASQGRVEMPWIRPQ